MDPNTAREPGAFVERPAFGALHARRVAQSAELPDYLKFASVVLRATFILSLVIVAARVSAPQAPDAAWSSMPAGDMTRVAIGTLFALCMLRQLFRFPRDPGAHRTWLYLGLALAPLSLICLVAVW